ncbi:MAG TPA: hypothetical protein VGQ21_05910 [Thermoanaerobaculia bacterium]|jgi:hypothetical protein|nr:hypothetical protein [Thermoanaerobaculia bacterium]
MTLSSSTTSINGRTQLSYGLCSGRLLGESRRWPVRISEDACLQNSACHSGDASQKHWAQAVQISEAVLHAHQRLSEVVFDAPQKAQW